MSPKQFVIAFFAILLAGSLYLGTKAWHFAETHPLTKQYRVILEARSGAVIVGDSHMENAFITRPTDYVNLAVGGTTFWMWKSMLDSYGSRRKIEKLVIIASPHIFADYRINNASPLYRDLPIGGFLQPRVAFNSVSAEITRRSLLHVAELPRRIIPETKTVAAPAGPPKAWVDESGAQRVKSTKSRVKEHALSSTALNSPMALAYRDLIVEMAASGTRVCLLTTPVTPLYEELLLTEENRNTWNAFVEALGKVDGVRHVHFRMLSEEWPLEQFLNQDHLNRAGSEVFSPRALAACFDD